MQGIEALPAVLAELLSISEASAGILLSIILIMALVMPVLIVGHGKDKGITPVIMAVLGLLGAIGLGWIDGWVLLLLITVCGIVIVLVGIKQ